ncbi:MAG: hypothetical protein VW827_06905 [Alphaproteobacteria bacterium]
MPFVHIILLITLVTCTSSCGKKAGLDRFPGSDYPKTYPKSYD